MSLGTLGRLYTCYRFSKIRAISLAYRLLGSPTKVHHKKWPQHFRYQAVIWLTKLNKWQDKGHPYLTPLFRKKVFENQPQFCTLDWAYWYNSNAHWMKSLGTPSLCNKVHNKICEIKSKAFLKSKKRITHCLLKVEASQLHPAFYKYLYQYNGLTCMPFEMDGSTVPDQI